MNPTEPESAGENKPTQLEQIAKRLEYIFDRGTEIRDRMQRLNSRLTVEVTEDAEGRNVNRPSRLGLIGTINDALDHIDMLQGTQEKELSLLSNII